MTTLIERLRLGTGTSPDHLLLIEAADVLEKREKCLHWAWKGFDDIEDDARVLATHATPELQGMVGGIQAVAEQHRATIAVELALPPVTPNRDS